MGHNTQRGTAVSLACVMLALTCRGATAQTYSRLDARKSFWSRRRSDDNSEKSTISQPQAHLLAQTTTRPPRATQTPATTQLPATTLPPTTTQMPTTTTKPPTTWQSQVPMPTLPPLPPVVPQPVVIPQQTPQLAATQPQTSPPVQPQVQQQVSPVQQQQQQQQPPTVASPMVIPPQTPQLGAMQPQASLPGQPQLQPQAMPTQQQQQQQQQPQQPPSQQLVQPQLLQPQQVANPVQVIQPTAAPAQALPASGSPGFKDNAYVELKTDPTVGGFLQKDASGKLDVWPRMDGKTFTGFLGYGYNRVKASGGKVADDINPEEWQLVRFPVAPTGPAAGGEEFWTQGPRSHHADYQGMIGKVLRFTLGGLGSLDCGCNANFYAVRRGAGCDGSGARPNNCEEIDFFEGNKFAWHSTLHALADIGETDGNGLCTGYGGTLPTRPNFPSFSGEEYGPNGTMIDTTKPFSVAASFPKRADGKLKGMCVELSQEGKPSMKQPLFMHLYEYKGSVFTEFGGGGTNVENGMGKIEQRLNEGVTTLSSMWTAPNGGMRWLDGAASQHGPKNIMDGKCTWDGGCSGYSIRNVVLEDLPLEAISSGSIELI